MPDTAGKVLSCAVWKVRSVVLVSAGTGAGPGLPESRSSLRLVPLTPAMDHSLL